MVNSSEEVPTPPGSNREGSNTGSVTGSEENVTIESTVHDNHGFNAIPQQQWSTEGWTKFGRS